MSDDTTQTTSETSTVTANPAPENVVPFTAASETTPATNNPEASSATEQNPQVASTDVSATPAAEQTEEPQLNSIQDAVNHVINNVDINTVSHHDVVHDLFRNAQEHAFKLMLAAKLFEQMLIRDSIGLKGKVYDLLRHADESVVNEVHAILEKKVAVPVPTEVIPPNEDQAVS